MSSDAGYAAFLGRAQKYHSPLPKGAPATEKPEVDSPKTATTTTRVPGERYYVSDADEPFESVSFSWEKKTLPDKCLYICSSVLYVLAAHPNR